VDAQIGLGIASIGGKDSMSGSFEQQDVASHAGVLRHRHRQGPAASSPPSSRSRRAPSSSSGPSWTPSPADPNFFSLKANYKKVEQMMEDGMVAAASSVGYGGLAEALFKMGLGNHIGFKMMNNMATHDMF